MRAVGLPSSGVAFRAALENLERVDLDLAPSELPGSIGRLEAIRSRLFAEMVKPESLRQASQEIAPPSSLPTAKNAAPGAGETSGRISFRVEEAADALGVSVGHVRNEIARGNLPVAHLGRAIVIPAEALRHYIDARTEFRRIQ